MTRLAVQRSVARINNNPVTDRLIVTPPTSPTASASRIPADLALGQALART